MRTHIFYAWLDDWTDGPERLRKWEAQCPVQLYGRPTYELDQATCLHCLKRIRDIYLRRAEYSLGRGLEASQQYESLKRKRT